MLHAIPTDCGLCSEGKVKLHIHQRVWNYFQQHASVRFLMKSSVAVMLGLLVLCTSMVSTTGQAHAMSSCANGDIAYRVVGGDTLSRIGSRYGVSWPRLAAYNRLANPNLIFVHEVICIPGRGVAGRTRQTWSTGGSPGVSRSHRAPAPGGSGNVFPYGVCTWWADQRYFQLHHVFVPWRTQANAWQWVARAYQFGWRVSSQPIPGSIVVLQPWVQGAYGAGHVAVVERILPNGHVIASNMNWGWYPWRITYVQFAPGPGVAFVTQ